MIILSQMLLQLYKLFKWIQNIKDLDFYLVRIAIFDEKKWKFDFWGIRISGGNHENRSDGVEINDWYDIFLAIDNKAM